MTLFKKKKPKDSIQRNQSRITYKEDNLTKTDLKQNQARNKEKLTRKTKTKIQEIKGYD
jgi:hypothetical protein